MPVDVAPQAAHAVEIRPAVDIDQRAALGPLDHQRLVLGHLRKRMPDDLAIPLQQFVARWHRENGQGGRKGEGVAPQAQGWPDGAYFSAERRRAFPGLTGRATQSFAINSKQISRTRPGLTFGLRFFTWPTRLPAAWSLPPLMSATILGFAATISWHSAISSRFVDLRDALRLHHFGRRSAAGDHLGEHLAATAGVEIARLGRRAINSARPAGRDRKLLDRDVPLR